MSLTLHAQDECCFLPDVIAEHQQIGSVSFQSLPEQAIAIRYAGKTLQRSYYDWTWDPCSQVGPATSGPQSNPFCLLERDWHIFMMNLTEEEGRLVSPPMGGAGWLDGALPRYSKRAEAKKTQSSCNATAPPILFGHEDSGGVWALFLRNQSLWGSFNKQPRITSVGPSPHCSTKLYA